MTARPELRTTDGSRDRPRGRPQRRRARDRACGPSEARLRGERGALGGLEVLPLALLVFTAGMLLVMNVWAIVDARLAVTGAAREAVRTAVEAPDPSVALGSGEAAARRQFAGSGRDVDRLDVTWSSGLGAAGGTDTFGRCRRLVVTASYAVPAVAVPWIGGLGRAVTVSATATELVDPLRDDVPGVGCGR